MNFHVQRMSRDEAFLQHAFVEAQRGTCRRRQVACIIVSEDGRTLSTGRNGQAPKEPHCTDVPCPGVGFSPGTGLDMCDAIHAEQNAITYLAHPEKAHTIYCTDSPCVSCVKLLLATSATRLVFARLYPHQSSQERWERQGRLWIHLPMRSFMVPVPQK